MTTNEKWKNIDTNELCIRVCTVCARKWGYPPDEEIYKEKCPSCLESKKLSEQVDELLQKRKLKFTTGKPWLVMTSSETLDRIIEMSLHPVTYG